MCDIPALSSPWLPEEEVLSLERERVSLLNEPFQNRRRGMAAPFSLPPFYWLDVTAMMAAVGFLFLSNMLGTNLRQAMCEPKQLFYSERQS